MGLYPVGCIIGRLPLKLLNWVEPLLWS